MDNTITAEPTSLAGLGVVPAFTATRAEYRVITRIVDRALELFGAGMPGSRLDLAMDIEAAHSNGCPIDLEGLLGASDFNFAHDVTGIVRHIDRTTGKLNGDFLPRYAQVYRRKS